ncbi:hypothetical protein GN958_ATG07186, partial [Phytophthora infestans]
VPSKCSSRPGSWGGASIQGTSKLRGVQYRTLASWGATEELGTPRKAKRRGPAPLLPAEAEINIYEWIICKASEIYNLLFERSLSDGWYKRFMQRFPEISVRTAQSISKTRNSITSDDVTLFYTTLAAQYGEHALDACQVLNMDETSFASRKNSKTVVAAKGSRNRKLRTLVNTFVGADGNDSISKRSALKLAGLAWQGCRVGVNVQAGFKRFGIYPLSLAKMMSFLENFQWSGTPESRQVAAWLQM